MIVHCYLYKLKDKKLLRDAEEKLQSMKERIPQIEYLEVGVNFSESANAYDLMQYSRFQSMEDYDSFSRNEYHQEIKAYFSKITDSCIKLDCEF